MFRLHILNLANGERRHLDFDTLIARVCASIPLNARPELVLTFENL